MFCYFLVYVLLPSHNLYVCFLQCVICPQKGGRVEYVNTYMLELVTMFLHKVKQYKWVGRTLPTPSRANHTLASPCLFDTFSCMLFYALLPSHACFTTFQRAF